MSGMDKFVNRSYLLFSKINGILNNPSNLKLYLNDLTSQRNFGNVPSASQVVICGSGIVGNSVAYHLSQEGWKDVVVIEQNTIGSGTSTKGSGVVGLLRDSSERWVTSHSLELLKKLQREGHQVGLRKCGSINLAQTPDRAIALKRRLAHIKPNGLDCEWVDRDKIQQLHPLLHTTDLEGAVWCSEDSVADVQAVCSTLAYLAQKQGVKFVEDCQVLSIESCIDEQSLVTPRVSAVKTSRGTIKCEYFVNAAGIWSRQLGEKSSPSVRIPAFPADHFHLHTVPVLEARDSLPIVRDYDSFCFCLTRDQEFILGGFEPNAKPAFENAVPKDWKQRLRIDTEHFQSIKHNVLRRIPVLRNVQFKPLINVPDNFTPNGKWIFGETPELDNYFVATGMNGNPLQGGCGAGKAIAEWIIYGAPSTQMLPFDVRRFLDLHNNKRYLKERMQEVVGRHYAIDFPSQMEFEYARKLRCSPIFVELEAQGAVFGSRMGFERPLYFDVNHKRGDPPSKMAPGSFHKPAFFHCIRQEYLTCREGVGVMDLSSFTKIEIKSAGVNRKRKFEDDESEGNQVVAYMQKLSSNDVNVPVGGLVHTGMHNERGGYENDCLLIRTTENSYMMLAPTIQQTRIMDWMRRQITLEACVSISDITSMYSVLSIVGPKSRDMLSMLCNTDLSFHGNKSKVGHDYGVKNIGMMTLRALRVEKFIPFWAEELDSTTNPFEVGKGYRVKLNKNYFIGKFALMQEQKVGPLRRLVHFLLEDDFDPETEVWPWGNEPLYRNGHLVGRVTSSAYGFTLGGVVCLGWVQHHAGQVVTSEYVMEDAPFEIDIAGKRFSLKASLVAPQMPVAKMDGMAYYRPKVRGILT